MIAKQVVLKTKDILFKRKLIISISIMAGIILSQVVLKSLTPRYKVTSQISLPSQYFQNPLVRDFLPETGDSGELRALRETIIQSTFDPQVVKDLGMKHHLFPPDVDEKQLDTFDINELRKRIEIVWLGSSSFLLAFSHSNPNSAYIVLEEIMSTIKMKLVQDRKNMLVRLRNALQERLEAIAFGNQINNRNMLESRPDLVTEERLRVERDYNDLLMKYSGKHPTVVAMKTKLDELKKYESKSHPELSKPKFSTRDFSQVKIEGAAKDLFQDLLKKFHYVEVVLFLDEQNQDGFVSVTQAPFVPTYPIFPKRSLLLIWGACLGFLVGCGISFALEYGILTYVRSSKKPIPS